MTHFGQRGACSMGCRRYHPSHQRASAEPCSLGVRRAAILLAASSMSRGMDCIFCRPQRTILAETKLSLAVLDGFPVSKGHTLVIPKRHVALLWEMTTEEYADAFALVRQVKDILPPREQHPRITRGCGNREGNRRPVQQRLNIAVADRVALSPVDDCGAGKRDRQRRHSPSSLVSRFDLRQMAMLPNSDYRNITQRLAVEPG